MRKIPLAKVSMGKEEIEAVSEVIRSGWVSHGDYNTAFEEAFARRIGTRYAIATSSCFTALFAVLKSARITGEVIVPSFTFGASVNAIELAGAIPVFADIDRVTRNVTAEHIRKKLTLDTRAIMLVHFGGQPCVMDEILQIAQDRHLLLIEDSAQTIGATFRQKQAGSFGIGCFSFFATKNISTGEGGMIALDDAELYEKLRLFIAHGIPRNPVTPWRREVALAGANFRMSHIHAAIGLAQLRKLDVLNGRRIEIASKYDRFLSRFESVCIPEIAEECTHVYQMYTVCVPPEIRNLLVEKLNSQGVMASVHFDPPVHLHPYYRGRFKAGNLENTERLSREILTLPIYPDMADADVDYVCSAFGKAYTELTH